MGEQSAQASIVAEPTQNRLLFSPGPAGLVHGQEPVAPPPELQPSTHEAGGEHFLPGGLP